LGLVLLSGFLELLAVRSDLSSLVLGRCRTALGLSCKTKHTDRRKLWQVQNKGAKTSSSMLT